MRNRNRFFLFQPLERHDLFALARFDQLLVEVLHPAFLPANIERAVTTDREEPSRRASGSEKPVVLKFHKSLLHHIARPVPVAGDSGRELQERKLKPSQVSASVPRSRHRPAFVYHSNPLASQTLVVFFGCRDQPGFLLAGLTGPKQSTGASRETFCLCNPE